MVTEFFGFYLKTNIYV